MLASTGARASVRVTDAIVASRARRLYLTPGTSPSSRTRRPIRGGATADDAADSADVHAERMRPNPDYDAQRKLRMSWMHWLHDKPKHARWAADWQREAQAEIEPLAKQLREKEEELQAKRFVLSDEALFQRHVNTSSARVKSQYVFPWQAPKTFEEPLVGRWFVRSRREAR